MAVKKKAKIKAKTTEKKSVKKTDTKKAAQKAVTKKKLPAGKGTAKKDLRRHNPREKQKFTPEPVAEPTTEQLWELIKKGRNRGFVTEVELLHTLPYPEQYLDLYEGFLDLTERNGIS